MKEHLTNKAWHSDDRCIYCHEKLDLPESRHEMHFHYKETRCKNCGKKIWFRVTFMGSGHDKLSFSELEKKMV